MIEICGLHKNFGELHVLKGIDLKVPKGEVLSVIGASGSGKSTLLYCINGLELIQQGTIHVDGIDIHAKDTDINVVRQNLGMVFQQWNSFSHLTVLENVALSPKILRKMSQQESNHIAEKQLRLIGHVDKLSNFSSAFAL